MKVTILQSSKSCTQSANAKPYWTLCFDPDLSLKYTETHMKWLGSKNTNEQIQLKFDTLSQAIRFASACNMKYEVIKSNQRNILPKNYANNFTFIS